MRPDPGVSGPIIQLTPLYTILLMRFYLIKLMSNVRPYNTRQTNASASTSLINVQVRSMRMDDVVLSLAKKQTTNRITIVCLANKILF